jgi:hypothetical protein
VPDDAVPPQRPSEPTPADAAADQRPAATPPVERVQPWYRKVRTWVVATAVAAVTTLVTTAIVTGVQDAASRLSPPVDIAVQRLIGCPSQYVVPGRVETVPTPPPADQNPVDRDRWARDLGGADGGFTSVRITVTGTAASPVVLQDLRFDVLERRQPIDGILTKAPCGDILQERLLDVDLEPTPPAVTGSYDQRDILGSAPGTPEQPVRFPYTVSTSSVEQFLVIANAKRCHCVWQARLLWTSGDRQGETIIDDSGQPFVTHGVDGYPVYYSYAGEPLTSG